MHCITHGFKIFIMLLDRCCLTANFLNISLIVAGKKTPLQFIREDEMPVIVITGIGQILFLEYRHVSGLILCPFQTPVGLHFRKFGFRMGSHVMIFQDITLNQVMVIGEFIPFKQIAGKAVTYVHACGGQRLTHRSSESTTENGAFTTVCNGAILCQYRFSGSIGTDTII